MATFLTTPHMNPALRARVERAVSHRTRARHNAAKLGLKSPFASAERIRASRVIQLLALLLVVGLGSATYVVGQRALEQERASLLAAMEEHRAQLPAGYEDFIARVDPFIDEASAKEDPGELIDPAMLEPGALDAWLGRPAVYVHAAAAELRDVKQREEAASSSDKDAFLYCLMSPAMGTSDKELLAAVQGVYFAGARVDEQTENVRRLAGTRVGLSVLGPDFEARVRAADEALALKKLRKDFEAAPTGKIAKAVGAELLIVVAAEPGSRGARVVLADLGAMKPLLRLRLRAPPPPAKESATAAIHRAAMEDCGLAMSVRGSVEDRGEAAR